VTFKLAKADYTFEKKTAKHNFNRHLSEEARVLVNVRVG